MFNPINPKQSFPELEKGILKYWKENKTFEKSVELRPKSAEYVFYDGPPFATGLPHYGHLLAGTMKDVVPRYWTMRGKRVERRFGWDCHGLPIEYEVEKELGLKGRKDIVEKYGVHEFSEKCRSVVMKYSEEWKSTVERMGRWVDMENDYKTMDPSFMESIWWVFNQLWEKDLVYKGHKSMHVCPRCVTPLSNFEVTLGYQDVDDQSVIWKFPLVDDPQTSLLAWTTTPWSTLSTMGLAIRSDFTYIKIKKGDEYVICVKERLDFVVKGLTEGEYEIIEEFSGKELVGLEYQPIQESYKDLPEVSENKKTYHVFATDYVENTEGTGIVTINGSYGEIDMQAAKDNGLPIVMDVNMDGTFNEIAGEYQGKWVKDAEKELIKNMKANNRVWRAETYRHSYPHCWRCDSPLLNYATSTWFVNVEEIKKRMVEENAKVHWVPNHVGAGRFHDWLSNARDWCISRNRFWGTPLPIWESEDGDHHVIQSIQELEELTGQKVPDIHKHLIDDLTFEKNGKTYKRIPEVFDCWFESGSMPYAQMHYPFENKEKFEQNFPAEYIAEGLDQTRGWFYTLTVLGVALFDRPAFKNVVVNGMILAEDGKKMSKRLKNYPDPNYICDEYGADALRFYLMTSPAVKAEPLRFSEKGVENVVRNVVLPIWNAYSFFVTYSNIDKWEAHKVDLTKTADLSNKLDRWILSELQTLLKKVTEDMDRYDLQAIRHIYTFIEHLTNWYIRQSRRRFWKSDDDTDKKEGYQTLYTVLTTLSQIIAPVMPMLAESMYQNLTNDESVHLTDWPEFIEPAIDHELNQEVQLVQLIARLGNSARAKSKIKNRQPLATLQLGLTSEQKSLLSDEQINVLKEELNIKDIQIADDPTALAKLVVRPNARVLGPKYGKEVQNIIREAKAGNVKSLENGNYQVLTYELTPEDCQIGYEGEEGMNIESDRGVVVALDTHITEDLKLEGLARDLIRQIQDMRKEAGYNVEDRITVGLTLEGDQKKAAEQFKRMIANEVLADEIQFEALQIKDLEKEGVSIKR